MAFGLAQPISTTIIVDDNEQLSEILAELDDAPARLDALELRASLLESSDVTLQSQLTTLEGRADDLDAGVAAFDGRATTLEGRADALEAADVVLDGRVDALEVFDAAADLRLDALETRATALEAADVALDDRVTVIEELQVELQASIAALHGLSGPFAITTSFQSPLSRWAPSDDRRDVLECTIANGVCRIWAEIGNLDPGLEYSLEIRPLVRDGGTSARRITARAFLLPVGTQVAPPVEAQFATTAQSSGTGSAIEELSIQGALLGADTPCRLLIELTAGTSNSVAQPYRCIQMFVAISEVGPI